MIEGLKMHRTKIINSNAYKSQGEGEMSNTVQKKEKSKGGSCGDMKDTRPVNGTAVTQL